MANSDKTMEEDQGYTGPDLLTRLVPELVLITASYLDLRGLAHLAATCKNFHNFLIPELYKADIGKGDCHAMWWACMNGNIAVIEAAINHGESVNRHFEEYHEHKGWNEDEDLKPAITRGTTPLIMAIVARKHNAVKCLISHGADIDEPDSQPPDDEHWNNEFCHYSLWHPINWALDVSVSSRYSYPNSYDDRYDILLTLLEAGADANQTPTYDLDSDESSDENDIEGAPISHALRYEISAKVVQLLLDHGADPLKSYSMWYYGCSTLGPGNNISGNAMEMLLQLPDSWLGSDGPEKFWILYNHAGGRLSVTIHDLLTFSMSRATGDKLKLLKRLHELGHFNIDDVMTSTDGHASALQALLSIADTAAIDDLWAADTLCVTRETYGCVLANFVHFFLNIGARLDYSSGAETLFYLCSINHNAVDDVIDVLLSSHPSLSQHKDETGRTALHMASRLQIYPNLFHGGIKYDPLKRIKMLLGYGLEADAKNKEGVTPLHWACFFWEYTDSIPLIEILLRYGADINATDIRGDSPLLLLLKCNEHIKDPEELAATIRLLINAGASTTLPDEDGMTAESWMSIFEIKY